VAEAISGEDALTRPEGDALQLILLDWQIPGLDGLETCRAIRASFNVPVIMVTSREKSGREQALAAGAVDYVTKPFELRDLLSHVDSALSR